MSNPNLDEFIRKEIALDAFSEKLLVNYLTNNPTCLYVDGKWEVRGALTSKERIEYDKIDKRMFSSESLDPKEEYIPIKYFVKTHGVYERLDKELTPILGADQVIFFAGAKSMGKTLSLNIWLKENDAKLEENKIFWIRCDCKKLIDILLKINKDIKSIANVEDIIHYYFNIQLLYVLAKDYNNEKKPFLKTIFDLLNNEDAILRKVKNPPKTQAKIQNIQETIEKINKDIIIHKNCNRKGFHYGRDKILFDGLKIGSRQVLTEWIDLSNQIQEILKEKGYRFLKIIDAVDNYKKYTSKGEHDDVYDFILDKVYNYHQYYTQEDLINDKESLIVLLRQNTYKEYFPMAQNSRGDDQIEMDCFPVVFEKNTLKEKKDIYKNRYDFITKEFSEMNGNSTIMKIFNLIGSELNPNQYLCDFLEEDRHIGYYLRNCFNMIPTLIHFQKKYDLSHDKLIDFKNEYQPVNLLLNKYFSLNSDLREEEFNIEIGKMLFNIFYYNDKKYEENVGWQGLCNTRILQHLCINDSPILKSNLIKKIHSLFFYEEDEINRNIIKLVDYSLLRLKKPTGANSEPIIEVSKKGKKCLDLIYSNIDILYHCSLDTPLPATLQKKSYICPHNINIGKGNYAINCTKSSLTFIQFLKYIDKKERDLIADTQTSDKYKLPLYFNEIIKELNKRLGVLVQSLRDDTYREFIDFLEEFIGNIEV